MRLLVPAAGLLRSLVALSTFLAAGCHGADPPVGRFAPTPDPASIPLSACQKADALWNDRILPSRYDTLPALTSPGVLDLLSLLSSHFSAKAFTAEGDELEAGRRKLIHAFGAEARLRLVVAPAAAAEYTGILADGAECVIARFSLASRATADSSLPALALKFFIAGTQPSVNLLLMHSVDVQAGHDFFAQTFSNVLPPAQTFATRFLASAFERSAVEIGAKDSNPGRLTLEHLAGVHTDGRRVAAPRTPYQLLFKAAGLARTLMRDARAGDDFRTHLAALPVGQAVFDVFAVNDGEAPEAARPIGQLILSSPLVSSRYGDEKLYFRHHTARN